MPVGMGTIFGTMASNVDNDWYVVSLEAGRPYTVSLKGIPEGDDYDLYIFDTNILDIGLSFNGGNADEVLNFTPTVTGNYYIHADCHTLGTGSDHSYQLLIYPDDTAPDAYEPNDSIGTAKTISNNIPISGTINIGTDEDWYEFNVDNAGKLTVTLDSIPNDCDYDVEIYDVESNLLSGSYFSSNTNEKADVLVGVGNYYVRIYSYSGSSESAYSLNANLSIPDLYEVNDSVSSATEVLVDSSSFGTIDNIKDEDYFKVDIEETENYVFELQNIHSGKDYDLSLFDSLGNAIAYSWNSSNNDELINILLNPGCYYIKIHTYSGFSCEQNYILSIYKENVLTLSMPYIRANAGDTISVPIAIQNLPSEGLCSFDFTLDYDATALTYLDYTVDYSDPSWALVDTEQVVEANEIFEGTIKVLFLDNSTVFTKPLNQSGTVIKLNFQVNEEVSDGVYNLNCSYGSFAKVSSNDIIGISHAILKDGLIMTGSYGLTSLQTDVNIRKLTSMSYVSPLGDINNDGSINSLDFARLRGYLLGTMQIGNGQAADLDGDGSINSLDFGLLRKYLLGIITEFPANGSEVIQYYSITQVINILHRLEEVAKAYYWNVSSSVPVRTLVIQYIRRINYNDGYWPEVAGEIDSNFVSYVDSNASDVANFFSGNVYIFDPQSSRYFDFDHFAATLNAILHDSTSFESFVVGETSVDNLAGWAGDLQQIIRDLQDRTENSNNYDYLYQTAKEIIGGNSMFSFADILADTDAVNIGKNMKSHPSYSIPKIFKDYYYNGTSSGYNWRYRSFLYSICGSTSDYSTFKSTVGYYTTVYYQYPVKWPIIKKYQRTEPTQNQMNALRDAFSEFIWTQRFNEIIRSPGTIGQG